MPLCVPHNPLLRSLCNPRLQQSLHRRGRPHQLESATTRTKMHGAAPPKSSPIQIPPKRKPMALYPSFPQPMSPELLFDMSPESSDPSVSRESLSAAASSVKGDADLLYFIPLHPATDSSDSNPTQSSASLKTSTSSPLARNTSSDSHEFPNVKHPVSRRGHLVLDENDLSPEPPRRESSTTRVTGFHPIKGPVHDAQFEDQYRPVERLSPGPYWDSFTSSPWILPGKGESSDEGLAYSQAADPNEFKRQLLRRIENQNRPRFAALRSYCA